MDILLNLKRIDLGAKSGPGGLNPLHFSIQGRSSDLVERLLQAKVCVIVQSVRAESRRA